jgi:O-antigen/teichoic acid export membrane protein
MEHFRSLRSFALILAFAASAGLAAIAYSPVAFIWFQGISGLSTMLTEFAIPPLRLLVLLPALSVVLSLQRSMLLTARRTTSITLASGAEIVTIAGLLWVGIHVFDVVGVISAAVALVIGRFLTNLWLIWPCWQVKALRRSRRPATQIETV